MIKPKVRAPLVDADVDLRSFPFMPLEIDRLQQSKQWRRARNKPEVGFYSMNLWMAAWHKVPAGSLPDDDEDLADDAWCPLEKWPEVKEAVMRGWEKCTDGRWYHSFLAEKVNEAWGKMHKNKKKTAPATEAARVKKLSKKSGGNPENSFVTEPSRTDNGTVTEPSRIQIPSVTDQRREERRREDKNIDSSSKSTIGVLITDSKPILDPDDDEVRNFGISPSIKTLPSALTRQRLIAQIQDFSGGLKATTAEARLDGWVRVLSIEDIQKGLDHCRSQGFDRNGVRNYFDGLVQTAAMEKIKLQNQAKASTQVEKQEVENPDWVAVRDAILTADPNAKTWFKNDVIKQVAVNGISVTFRLGTRFLRDHVQKVYGTKIAAAWQSRNPKITEFRYEVGL